MTKPILLSLSVCLVLLSGCLAHQEQQQRQRQNECNLCKFNQGQINPLKPYRHHENPGGEIEIWNPNTTEFKCAGVTLDRYTFYSLSLALPSYSNTPELLYVEKGEGYIGIVIPGCPETYEEPQSSKRQQQESSKQHQKVRFIKKGDLVALPIGIVYWIYNEGPSKLVVVNLLDTTNAQNQLDGSRRRFYLAGGDQNDGNIFQGFDLECLENAFNVSSKVAENIQGRQNNRVGRIIKLKRPLDFIRPPRSQSQSQPERKKEDERQKQQQNMFSETICTLRLVQNIGEYSSADIYNPEAGSITTVNNLDLPALGWLDLSAERGNIYENTMLVPQYNLNAHGIVYALEGSADIQVVGPTGETVFNGTLRQRQVLLVPQNYAVAAQTQRQTLEYVTFRTNGRALTATLSGRKSVMKGMPTDVIRVAYNLTEQEANEVKNNNENLFFIALDEPNLRQVA